MAKWKKIGQIKKRTVNGNEVKSIELENSGVMVFLDLLKSHGKNHIKNMTDDELTANDRLKYNDPARIPKIQLSIFDPHQNAPDFILGDVCIKIGE